MFVDVREADVRLEDPDDGDVRLGPYPVGAILNETKLFRRQEADGIFGLRGEFTDAVRVFSMCFRTRTMSVGLPEDAETYAWIPLANAGGAFALDLISVEGANARGLRALIDSGTTDVILPRRFAASYTRQGGLCEVHFKGMAAPLRLDRCIPPDKVHVGEYVVLGTAFFRHIPRIAFTRTHIGLGVATNATCTTPPLRHARPPDLDEQAAALWVGLSCVSSIVLGTYVFFSPRIQ